jgi:hypothetical protein
LAQLASFFPFSNTQNDTFTIKLEYRAANVEYVSTPWKSTSQYGLVDISEKDPKSALELLVNLIRDFFF